MSIQIRIQRWRWVHDDSYNTNRLIMVDTETKRMSCWGASDWRTPGQALLSPSFRRYREEIATGNPELDVSYVRGGEVVLENNFIVLWDSDRPDKPYSPAKVPKVLAGKTEI